MVTHIDVQIEIHCILAAAGFLLQLCKRLQQQPSGNRPIAAEDYLSKMARTTGHSEHEIIFQTRR